jgi:hypothetical protein
MSVEAIARAVLYEGYLLYPYRASSLKNRRRWAFGALFPPAWPDEPSRLRAECLLEGDGEVTVRARFLQHSDDGAVEREVTGAFDFAPLTGTLNVTIEPLGALRKVTVELANTSMFSGGDRDAAALSALCSAHLILKAHGGSFVSQTDPRASACQSQHVWPILVGDPARRDTMLCSPILLEDFPRLAGESPHDLFDSGEIDEILTLRILTLTDEEKRQISDVRARALLERVESLDENARRRLHGRLRSRYAPGDRVRLKPRQNDVMDLALRGRAATIVSVEEDFEDRVHLAVVVDDDPGKDLGVAGMPGHRFFFAPDEVEPLP